MTWARQLTPRKLEAGYVHVAPLPGKREVVKFMTQSRRDELAGLLSRLLGQPVRVTVETPTDNAPPATGGGTDTAQLSPRDVALNLPLVRQVFELFPDSTLIEVRPESQVEPAPAAPAAADSSEVPSDAEPDDSMLGYDSMQDMNDDDDAES